MVKNLPTKFARHGFLILGWDDVKDGSKGALLIILIPEELFYDRRELGRI